MTTEHRHKIDKRLRRADELRVKGHRPHHGAWNLYRTWATEWGHAHGADPYATPMRNEGWSPMKLDRVEGARVLKPAAAATAA